ncbi:zeta toxin family protein [Streptomyces sp. NPDC023723]|uniref:zeta toxin family protein n=1 Tax=Streptomyces sp. NPDC023723 TaxID=3154323 RepID=UPI0033F77CD9
MTGSNTGRAVLSEQESLGILHRLILPEATQSAVPQARPVVVVVAGQPGAGKTQTADLLQAVLDRRGGCVRIGRDLYKPFHHRYTAALADDVRTAGARVRPDTVRWQAAVEAHVRAMRFDAVVESALADPDDFRAAFRAYRAAGHRIEIVTLATPKALSRCFCSSGWSSRGRGEVAHGMGSPDGRGGEMLLRGPVAGHGAGVRRQRDVVSALRAVWSGSAASLERG